MSKKKGVGLCLINTKFINEQANRNGATEDAQRVKDTLEKLDIHIKTCNDCTGTQMLAEVQKLAEDPSLDQYESVWLIISSHGEWDYFGGGDHVKKDYVQDKNQMPVTIESLTELLIPTKYPKLAGKPVVIIVQACRGERTSQTIRLDQDVATGEVVGVKDVTVDRRPYYKYNRPEQRSYEDIPDVVPVYTNQVLLWATTPDKVAFRTPMLKNLVHVMDNVDLKKTDVEHLFTQVIDRMAEGFTSNCPTLPPKPSRDLHQRKSAPMCYSMLLQKLYLA